MLKNIVFRDANKNGVRGSTEAGQANMKIFLDYNGNGNGVRDGDAESIVITYGTNFAQTRPTDNAARVVTVARGADARRRVVQRTNATASRCYLRPREAPRCGSERVRLISSPSAV